MLRAVSALFSDKRIDSFPFTPGADKLIKLWNAYTGDFIRTMAGHTEGVSDIAWSSDSELIASASDDKTVRIWSAETVRSR